MSNITIIQQTPSTIEIIGGTPGAPGAISVDAPNDGTAYIRKDSLWEPLTDEVLIASDTVPTPDTLVRTGADGLITPQFIDPVKYPSLVLDFATGAGKDEKPCATRYQSNGIQKLDGFENIVTFTRASQGSYYDSEGVLKLAASGEPRFDHDPVTLEQKGLLIEESRTNTNKNTVMRTVVDWNISLCTIIPNSEIAPDGTKTAFKTIPNSGVAGYITQPNINYVSGNTYTASGYFKAGEKTSVIILAQSPWASGTNYTEFNLSTGTPTDFGTATSTMTDVGNGWYRCSTTVTATATITSSWQVARVVSGDGVSGLYGWGLQAEAGSFPTSYIPSTDTFTSRASSATYFDSAGVRQTAAIDVGRVSYYPLDLTVSPSPLYEAATTNLLLNTSALSTQNVTVTAEPHTLSFSGTGTVTLSGASTAGPLVGVGSGEGDITTLKFTPTAGTLVVSVSGAVEFAQLEVGGYATSYYPSTGTQGVRAADVYTSVAATRVADSAHIGTLAPWAKGINGEWTVHTEYQCLGNTGANQLAWGLSDGTLANAGMTFLNGSGDGGTPATNFSSGAFLSDATLSTNAISAAVSHSPASHSMAVNGTLSGSDSVFPPITQNFTYVVLGKAGGVFGALNGHIKQLKYYPYAMTQAELEAITS